MEDGHVEIVANTPAEPDSAPSVWQRIRWRCFEIIAMLCWLYALTKLFVFDIDIYLLNLVAPGWAWLLDYKLPILLGLIAIAMLATRSLTLGVAVLYIAFYPFVLLFWKVPRFVLKQQSWLLAFAIVNAAISFFYSFRRDFIAGTLFLICAILIVTASNSYVLMVAAAVMLAIIAFAYYTAFRKALKPSAVFETYIRLFPRIRTASFMQLDASLRNVQAASMTEQQIQLRTSSLQNVVLFNRACLFISKKLRNYQRSGVGVISYVFGLVFLLIITIIDFGLVNYGMFKVDPTLYQFTYSHASLFAFIYYSAGSMFYAANGLVPIAAASQTVQLLQFFCGVLLVIILITVIVALRNEKYLAELEKVISSVEGEGRAVESVLRSDYNFDNIAAAISALEQAKAGLTAFIVYLTNNLSE